MTIIPLNFVVIMKDVGRSVGLRSHPGSFSPVCSTYWRIERSMSRQMRSDVKRIRPRTSIRSGFFKKTLLTMTGSFRNPKSCSLNQVPLNESNQDFLINFLEYWEITPEKTQQLCCPLFRATWHKLGSKRELWDRMRSLFGDFAFKSMRMLYEVLFYGIKFQPPIILYDSA